MRFLALFILAATIGLASCKKDDNNNDQGTSGTMTLKHDGSSWSANLAVVAVNSNGVLTITGSDNSANQCNVTLYNIPGTGTYELGVTITNTNTGRWTQGVAQDDTYTTMLGQGSGSCTITELTATKVSGTFHFTAKNMSGDEVSVTDGSFSADL